jgi:hypothetical protein
MLSLETNTAIMLTKESFVKRREALQEKALKEVQVNLIAALN